MQEIPVPGQGTEACLMIEDPRQYLLCVLVGEEIGDPVIRGAGIRPE
jgi:hypothetical protein